MSAIRRFAFEVATIFDENGIAWTPNLKRMLEKAVKDSDRTWISMSEVEVEHLAQTHEGPLLIRMVENQCKRKNWD